MACSTDFIEFVCNALAPLGEVRARKMMGDYVIYGCAYEGAKEGYILDLHDRRKALMVIETLWHHLPFPKSRKK